MKTLFLRSKFVNETLYIYIGAVSKEDYVLLVPAGNCVKMIISAIECDNSFNGMAHYVEEEYAIPYLLKKYGER